MPADPEEIQALREKTEEAPSELPEKPAFPSGVAAQKLVHEPSVHQIGREGHP
jgi:hypothetical protein